MCSAFVFQSWERTPYTPSHHRGPSLPAALSDPWLWCSLLSMRLQYNIFHLIRWRKLNWICARGTRIPSQPTSPGLFVPPTWDVSQNDRMFTSCNRNISLPPPFPVASGCPVEAGDRQWPAERAPSNDLKPYRAASPLQPASFVNFD